MKVYCGKIITCDCKNTVAKYLAEDGGGLGLMIPGALSDLVGLVLIGGVFAIQYVQNKKETLSKD